MLIFSKNSLISVPNLNDMYASILFTIPAWQRFINRRSHYYYLGWFTIYLNNEIESSLTIDICTENNNYKIHKQIERKCGMTFMRIKKRKIKAN